MLKEATVVWHKKTGLDYRLIPQPKKGRDVYALTANDGMVPGQRQIIQCQRQIIQWTEEEVWEMFDKTKRKI